MNVLSSRETPLHGRGRVRRPYLRGRYHIIYTRISCREPQYGAVFVSRTKPLIPSGVVCLGMSTTVTAASNPDLSEKQRRILQYLRTHAADRTYFKSRLIAEEVGLSAKEVGANMRALLDGDTGITVEKWGYSSGTTWKVTR